MSIEAMKRALDVLAALDALFSPVARDSTQRVWIHEAKESIEALRTAIQHAEAKTPSTDPMLANDIKPRPLSYPLDTYHRAPCDGPLNATWQDKPHRLLYDLIAAVAYYAQEGNRTHPAPGVPEQDWERKERLQSIADTAAASGLFGLAQKWANNEIHSYQFTHQAAAIVLKAMLAASPAQKGGE